MLDPKSLQFTNLHGHSHKSFGDSIYPTENLVKDAKKMGYIAAGISDHGSLTAMPDFFYQCEKEGIKPVVGIESYFVSDEVKDSQKQSRHLLVIVKNETGWKNLLTLMYKSSIPVKDGGTFYVKPRFTDKEIFQHSDGLVFSSACLNGVISDYLIKGDETSARIEALKWKENVQDFYIEIMPHRFKEQTDVNSKLVEIARDLDIPLLATLDVHYDHPDKHEAWMINGAIRRRQNFETFENHMSPDMYYKTIEQMIDDFRAGGLTDKEIEEAIQNSVKIANSVDFKWENRQQNQPVFNQDINAPQHLKTIAWQGLCKRFGGANKIPQEYINRLKMEWEVITQMGYADYFLILHDMVTYGKANNVLIGPGRGSACGSMMLWALHVTEVDSLKYKLPFERFLNPERTDTAPDCLV
jgi:DNA polymerase-3 subunit alpha